MMNITPLLDEVYIPFKAMVVYKTLSAENQKVYVEAYDMDADGYPLNAHPLSIEETTTLAACFDNSPEMQRTFLKPKGLLVNKVLYINPDKAGFAIWWTPPRKALLFFDNRLGIASGKANIPALVWKADKNSLNIYALKENKRPTFKTPLYHAPFFNIYTDGSVCMGTVDIAINDHHSLEDFIKSWQEYFFNSYFSHLLGDHNPVSVNIIQLWQEQVTSTRKFPAGVLIKNGITIKEILQ